MPRVFESKDGVRVEFTDAECDLIPLAKDAPVEEGGVHELLTVEGSTLKLVKEYMAHRAENAFDRSEVFAPLDNRGKLEITFRDGGKNVWFRDWIKRQPSKTWFALLKAADTMQVDDLVDLCAIAIATKYTSYTDEQKAVLFGPYPSADEEAEIRKTQAWSEEEPELFQKLEDKNILPKVAPSAAGGSGSS